MENKKINGFLKTASMLLLLEGAFDMILSVIALVNTGKTDGVAASVWMAGGVQTACSLLYIVVAIAALAHKNLTACRSLVLFALIFNEVVNIIVFKGSISYMSVLLSLVIPLLFVFACYKQGVTDKDETQQN